MAAKRRLGSKNMALPRQFQSPDDWNGDRRPRARTPTDSSVTGCITPVVSPPDNAANDRTAHDRHPPRDTVLTGRADGRATTASLLTWTLCFGG